MSLIDRIEQSPLAVIRTGLIESNYGTLSSPDLGLTQAEQLLSLLLGDLIIAPDEALRRISCGLLATRLCMPNTESLADLPIILRNLELHLRSAVSPAVKRDLVGVLDFLVAPERSDCHKWLEALVCSPSLLEYVALDISLSPIHLAMSRQVHYAVCPLSSRMVTRDAALSTDTWFYSLTSAACSFPITRSCVPSS